MTPIVPCQLLEKRRKFLYFTWRLEIDVLIKEFQRKLTEKIVDHVSDINMTYSSIAREYLIKEGFPVDKIIKTGSPMYEVLHHNNLKIFKL